jgi:hypothetical protein
MVFLGGSVLADIMKERPEFWMSKADYQVYFLHPLRTKTYQSAFELSRRVFGELILFRVRLLGNGHQAPPCASSRRKEKLRN